MERARAHRRVRLHGRERRGQLGADGRARALALALGLALALLLVVVVVAWEAAANSIITRNIIRPMMINMVGLAAPPACNRVVRLLVLVERVVILEPTTPRARVVLAVGHHVGHPEWPPRCAPLQPPSRFVVIIGGCAAAVLARRRLLLTAARAALVLVVALVGVLRVVVFRSAAGATPHPVRCLSSHCGCHWWLAVVFHVEDIGGAHALGREPCRHVVDVAAEVDGELVDAGCSWHPLIALVPEVLQHVMLLPPLHEGLGEHLRWHAAACIAVWAGRRRVASYALLLVVMLRNEKANSLECRPRRSEVATRSD